MLSDIETLVRLESPSKDAVAINKVQDQIQAMLEKFGTVKRHSHQLGDILHVQIPGISSERVLLMGHADTVYPHGTWKENWRVEGDKVAHVVRLPCIFHFAQCPPCHQARHAFAYYYQRAIARLLGVDVVDNPFEYLGVVLDMVAPVVIIDKNQIVTVIDKSV